MGTIRKKRTSALTKMSGFLLPPKNADLYPEDYAKKRAAELAASDPDWKWEAVLVNAIRGLWAIQYTDQDGYTERVSI